MAAKWALYKQDKEVIDAFANKQAMDSKKMHSDGVLLSKGIRATTSVAEWKTTKRKGRKHTKIVGLSLEKGTADKKIMAYLRGVAEVGELQSKTKMAPGETCAVIKFADIQKLMKAAGVKGSSAKASRRFSAAKAGKVFYDRAAKCWMWELLGTSAMDAVGPAPVRNYEGMRGIAYLFASIQMCR